MSLEYPCVYYDNEMCQKFSDDKYTSWCVCSPCGEQKLSNADRIRAMSDEELCEMLTIGTGGFDCGTCRDSNACDRECELHCAEWLKQFVRDGEADEKNP